jgi:hypothetical protein
MSRILPLLLAVVMVLCGGWVVLRTCGRGHHPMGAIQPRDRALTPTQAWFRYQQCQPRHWRYLMLQH